VQLVVREPNGVPRLCMEAEVEEVEEVPLVAVAEPVDCMAVEVEAEDIMAVLPHREEPVATGFSSSRMCRRSFIMDK
jgi:hypothetical protein